MTHRRFALNGETLQLDDALRSTIKGTFVRLNDGMTWYELAGPVDGKPVIFINGYSIPHYLWDHTFSRWPTPVFACCALTISGAAGLTGQTWTTARTSLTGKSGI